MTAKIVIDPGGDPVVGSRVMASSFVNTAFQFSNQDNSGVAGWKWEFIDTPYVSPTLEPKPAPTFSSTRVIVPDVKGWSIYVKLTTYRDPGRTIEDGVDTAVLGIRFDAPNDWVIPPAGATTQLNADRGWSKEVNRILADTNGQLGGGGGPRGREWWNGDSTDAGTLSGSIIVGTGTFVPEVDRINLWDGTDDVAANMPAFGAGDHNRRIGFLEATGSGAAGLTITAGGTNTINHGEFQGLAGIKVQGAGSLHVLQYDEFVDKFRVVYPAENSFDLRALVSNAKVVTISLPDPVNNDVTVSEFEFATIVNLSAASDFAEVTGFDTSLTGVPRFCRTKIFYNGDATNRVVLRNDNAGSSAPNRIFGPVNDRIVIQPGAAIIANLLGAWEVYDFGTRATEVRRAVVTTNVTPDIDGELVMVDASGGPVVVSTPSELFVGQRFAVMLVAGTTVTVNGVEDPDTGIPGGAVLSLRQGFRYEWRWTGLIWALAQQPATNRLRAILNDATNVLAGQAVYINGVGAAHGQPKVTKARANVSGTARFFGAAVADASDTNEMYVQTDGVLQIPAAQQVGTWNTGDKIYLDDGTAGKYKNSAGAVSVPVGWALDTPGGAFCRVWVDRAP